MSLNETELSSDPKSFNNTFDNTFDNTFNNTFNNAGEEHSQVGTKREQQVAHVSKATGIVEF